MTPKPLTMADLVAGSNAATSAVDSRFGRVDNQIEIDLTDDELQILIDAMQAGGSRGDAARQILDEAVAKAEANELGGDLEVEDDATPSSEGTGDAGARSPGRTATTVGEQFNVTARDALRTNSGRRKPLPHQ